MTRRATRYRAIPQVGASKDE